MLELPDVTLFGIDCFKPHRQIEAFDFSTRFVRFADIVLLTDTRKFPNLQMPPFGVPHCERKLRVVHHEESDTRVSCERADHYKLPVDYERASMTEPQYHFDTTHILFCEWDAAVLNPSAWDKSWLKYDFIGAPWPPHHEHGWEPCDGGNNVGNFGFSLRSKKFCQATDAALRAFGLGDKRTISCDMFCCRSARRWMEQHFGVRFAPDDVAARFSCENAIYSGAFGFHGRFTVQMNGWHGGFFDTRYP